MKPKQKQGHGTDWRKKMIKFDDGEIEVSGKGTRIVSEFIAGILFILSDSKIRKGVMFGLEALRTAGQKESVFLGELNDLIFKYEHIFEETESEN